MTSLQPPILPIQQEFDFLLGSYRPLLRVEEARLILHDCSDRHVENLLDAGRILGIDISGSGEGKRCLRLWKHTVIHLALRPEHALATIPLSDLLPHHRPTIYRRELARWCGCAENTVAAWELAGPRTDNRSVYHREAVIEFFTQREVNP